MGSSTSRPSPLAPPFQRMDSWDIKAARRLLTDYKEKDLDFGLDAQGLAEVIGGDNAWAESIIDAFGGTNGIVNVLAFISGAILVSSGAALEKANLVFEAMDFDMTEQISMDEMTIAFLCCARGYNVMSGTGKVPSDEELENVTLQAYRELSKSGGQSITKTEFTKWVMKYIGTASTAVANTEVTLQDMAVQFGLEVAAVKSISEEVLNELAVENNTTRSEEPVAEMTVAEVDGVEQQGEASELEVVAADEGLAEVEDQQPTDTVHLPHDPQHEHHIDEIPPQMPQHHEDEYNEEFQQETPRLKAPDEQVSIPATDVDRKAETAAAHDDEYVEGTINATEVPQAGAPAISEDPSQDASPVAHSDDPPADVNAFDTYDYTQDAYDASSGLSPPDPFESAPSADDEHSKEADDLPPAEMPEGSSPQEEGV